MVEAPRVLVPFVLKEFTQKLYQRQAILTFGYLTLASNLLVCYGLHTKQISWALLGRALFGVFSQALMRKVYQYSQSRISKSAVWKVAIQHEIGSVSFVRL